MSRLLVPLALFLGSLHTPTALANAGMDALFGSCEGSPAEAVTVIDDAAVAELAQVRCTVFGHIVMASDRYFWSFYGDVAPVVLTAQDDGPESELETVFNTVYFTDITAGELTGDTAQAAFDGARFGSHFPDGVLPTVHAIETRSNTGVEKTLYIYQHGTQIAGAIPYPDWFDRIDDRPLLPIFILDRATLDKADQ